MTQKTPPIHIRPVTPEDLDACITIEMESFPPDEAADAEGIETRINNFPEGFLVAEMDSQVVGQINSGATNKDDITDEAFKKLVGHDAEGCNIVIFSLSVLPEFRKQGIAGRLLREFMQRAGEQGREAVLLLCKNELVPYYTRFGFLDRGLSASTHGGVDWHEMACRLT